MGAVDRGADGSRLVELVFLALAQQPVGALPHVIIRALHLFDCAIDVIDSRHDVAVGLVDARYPLQVLLLPSCLHHRFAECVVRACAWSCAVR